METFDLVQDFLGFDKSFRPFILLNSIAQLLVQILGE